ncbi:pLS20_p028 family conjugation system transmembrane protein [Limosilactobacillus fastidiosus]|uniref:DUF8208 domain-containing protein n=1 Tax=Limosilactobacillus fastidiosus TaxID=2759855 RepID=A0A7W3TXW5_9LACO|nr:hypothetical protein [Limosilactobacillus fastidiosus]MBB1062395.1 hypothetical protein [Limosilactobacillus fastidiosus]MBB1085301.1 hypothetical protein [Limosilactobacillus fastidiosus]MCD7083470.1 hypothetical protein [Limosilactobacillus fastidiosus]MCD7085285.1 hypothetical protein [Limosilactobacillus fastidiosus]MCD7115228.1 hypothetical protein [Limosilactobacillus fastidiosus]
MDLIALIKYALTKLSLFAITETSFSTAAAGGPYTKIPDGDTGTVINFYINWSSYLHLNYGFLHATYGYLQKATVNLLFSTDRGLEDIYDTVFSFLGWEGNISNSSGPLYGLWYFFQFMGWSLLALGLLIVAFQSLMHRSDWGKIGTNVVLAAMTMTLLPMMMQMFNTVAVDAESAIKSVKGTEMTTDIAVQPIKNNVIDLSTLIRRDFGNFKYKPEAKKIRNVANWNVINSPKAVKEMDFGQYLDKKTMNDDLKLSKYKAGEAAMNYHLEDEHNQVGGGYIIAKNSNAGLGTLNDRYYSRYSVNWIGLIGQSLIIGVVLLIAGIRVCKDSYELTLMSFIAPLVAYRSIRSTKKLRDLISSIAGMYTSIVFMMALIRVYLIGLVVCQAKVPGMNWFERSIVILMLYAGGAFAMFGGLNYLERVTGVSQGLSDEAGQAMAVGALGGAAVGATAGLAGGAMGKVGGAVSRFSNNRSNSSLTSGNSRTNGINSSRNKSNGQNDTHGISSTRSQQNGQNNPQTTNTNQQNQKGGSQNNQNNQTGISKSGDRNSQNSASQSGGQNVNGGNQGTNSSNVNNGFTNNNEANNGISGQTPDSQNQNGWSNDFGQNGISNDQDMSPVSDDPTNQNPIGIDSNDPTQNMNMDPNANVAEDPNNHGLDNPESENSWENDPNLNSNDKFDPNGQNGIGNQNGFPKDDSFEGQSDWLNDMSSGQPQGEKPSFDEGTTSSATSSDVGQTQSTSTGTSTPNAGVRIGNTLQSTGNRVSNVSRSVRQHSTQYLKNHRFNIGTGNLHGRDSDQLD